VYVVLNVQLTGDWYRVDTPFYGYTYAATWALALAGLALGIREKDRVLMDVSLVLALVSVLTNKAYLGSPEHAWDPCVLGVVLMAIAFAVRRWLSKGSGGERHGFTAARLLDKDRAVLSAVSTASGFVRPGVTQGDTPSRSGPSASEFNGGRSGGGGASGSF
jgi:uncharacterized membrane protein YgcG